MKFLHSKKTTIILLFAFFAVVIGSGIFFLERSKNIKIVRAGVGDNVKGFAWNDSIGWIGFNSEDYICASSTFPKTARIPTIGDCSMATSSGSACGNNGICMKQDKTCRKDRAVFCGIDSDCNFGSCAADGYCDNSINNVPCYNNSDCQIDSRCGNPVEFGVTVEKTDLGRMGNFSGYAWSSNLGWISFNEAASLVTDNPSGSPYATILTASTTEDGCSGCTAAKNCTACYSWATGKIYGWAKIVNMGEDGWIRLDGDGVPFNIIVNQALENSSGWAWNGNVDNSGIGWVSFDCSDAPNDCLISNYHTIFGVNRPPKAIDLEATSTPCVGSAQDVSLIWFFDDDLNDDQTKFRIRIPAAAIDVTVDGVPGGLRRYDVHLPLGFNNNWYLTVYDRKNATSSESMANVHIRDREYPIAKFIWHVPNPSASELVLFSSLSQYASTSDPTLLVDCDEHCSQSWATTESADTISATTSSSTLMMFGNKTDHDIITLTVSDGIDTCSTSTDREIKERLPDWIESGK